MQKFLDPSSVALIGVPRNTGDGSFNNAEIMLRYGYEGKIFPINPNAKEICGLKVYPSITDVREAIDLAVISVARDRVIPMIDQCAQAGVTRAVIITQGFADADQKGKEMQEEIVRRAKANGIRIIGPNTMGVVNNFKKFTNSFIETARPDVFSPVSLIAQTGVLQVASQDMAYKHWGKAIDIGNGCDIDVVEALSYFADDPETKVVVIHMEGSQEGPGFPQACVAGDAQETGHRLQGRPKPGGGESGALPHRVDGRGRPCLRRRLQALRHHPRKKQHGYDRCDTCPSSHEGDGRAADRRRVRDRGRGHHGG